MAKTLKKKKSNGNNKMKKNAEPFTPADRKKPRLIEIAVINGYITIGL